LEKEYEKEQAEKAEKKRIADEQAARERAAKEAQEKEAREAREQAEQEAQEARKKQRIADSIKTQRAQEEEERQKAAEKAQRKQQLIAKYGAHWGQKVFEGKPVVGMTIAMCNDTGIAKFRTFHAEVGAKEVWVVNLIFATQTLTFVNGKLTEIETMKTSIF
jgi:flagellar biosynthesis GTPase FlhF